MPKPPPPLLATLAACLVAVSACDAAGPSRESAAQRLHVSGKPSLFPAFTPAVHDYVSRCGDAGHLKLRVRPPSGETVAVNGGARRAGAFRVQRRTRFGQQVVLVSRSHGRTAAYHVRCLPPKFPHWTVQRHGRTQAALYLVTLSPSGYLAMFDTNGVPIWWTRASTVAFDAKLLPNGDVAWSRHHTGERFGVNGRGGGYEEHTLTGRLVRVRRTVGSPTDHHDMQPLPNGDWMMLSYKRRRGADLRQWGGPNHAQVIDAVIQEIDVRGRVRWEWSSRHRLSPREQGGTLVRPIRMPDGTKAYDLMHMNSVQVHGDRILVSMHAANAVYDIDRRTKRIVWKLGGVKRAERLKTIGDPHKGERQFGHQHDARILPDGTVTVHDNRTGLNAPPRAVRYRIDEAAHTATLLEQINPGPAVRRSNFGGSATRLPGGNWVASWGDSRFVDELTPDSRVVFRLHFPHGWFSYKAFPIRPGVLTARELRHAMNRMPPRLRGR